MNSIAPDGFTVTDLIVFLATCFLAIGAGVFLAKKQKRAFSGAQRSSHASNANHNGGLPEVTFIDYGDMRFLHLGTPWVQGSMKISQPNDIHLDYLQRMMVWLLFADLEKVSEWHAMQMGLGSAALTKFCHKQLRMRTTAIELNPDVISTCRTWFALPEDNATLQVVLSDAAETAREAQWQEKVDVLQVDLYDHEADRPVLDSQDFYQDCHRMLTPHGCMTVNLFGRASDYQQSLQHIIAAFGASAVWAFKPTAAGNTIVLALRTPRSVSQDDLAAQAQRVQTRWSLPAAKWLKVFSPIH